MQNVVSITRPTWRAVREACERAEQMAGQTVEVYAEIGDMLIELQPKTPKGEWTAKCRESLYAPDMACQVTNDAANQQASRYMRLARHRADWQPHNPSSLNSALKLLPKKPVKTEQPGDKKQRYSWARVAQEEGVLTVGSGGGLDFLKTALRRADPSIERTNPAHEIRMRAVFRTIYAERHPEAPVFGGGATPDLSGGDHRKLERATRLRERELDVAYSRKNKDLQESFEKAVIEAAEARLSDYARQEVERARNAAGRADELQRIWLGRAQSCKALLVLLMDNWRTLAASLHPDRPDRTHEQLTKAADVLLRIKTAAEKVEYGKW